MADEITEGRSGPLFDAMGVPLEEGATHDDLKAANPSSQAKPNKNHMGQMDLWGRDKTAMAIERLQAYEPEDGYYVAFSGGKDSIVALDLVMKAGVTWDAHFRLMGGVDPPELIQYIKKHWVPLGVHIDMPEDPWHPGEKLTMWRLIPQKLAPPSKLRRFCCYYLKEPGGNGRVIVTGVRWAESVARRSRRVVEQCYSTGRGRMFVNPIIDWTDQDVWDYIEANDIPRPPLYGEPIILHGQPMTRKDGSVITRTRVGCIMCPMAGPEKMQADAERWPKIADAYRRACQRALDRRLKDGKGRIPIEDITWKTGDDLYNWWLQSRPEDPKADKSKGTTAMDLEAVLGEELVDDDIDGCPLDLIGQGGVLGMDTAGSDAEDDEAASCGVGL